MSHDNNNNQDAVLKTVIIIVLTTIIVLFLHNLLAGGGTGFFSNLYYGQGLDINSLVVSVLVTAVKILWFIFIISLVIGLASVAKRHLTNKRYFNRSLGGRAAETGYNCPCCGVRLTADFKFCPNCKASLKESCIKCGKELQVGWKCCPLCGAEKPQI